MQVVAVRGIKDQRLDSEKIMSNKKGAGTAAGTVERNRGEG